MIECFKSICFSAACTAFLLSPSLAKGTDLILQSTLESIPEIGDLSQGRIITESSLSAHAPEDADVVREYGFKALSDRSFATKFGPVRVQIYEMKNTKAAYGLCTYFRPAKSEQVRPLQIGDGGFLSPASLVFCQANFLVRFKFDNPPRRAAQDLMSQMARTVSEQIRGRAGAPPIIGYLPQIGLLRDSIRYFLGERAFSSYCGIARTEALGFKDQAEAVVADYAFNGFSGRLILIGYPNHPLARHYFRDISAAQDEIRGAARNIFLRRAGVLVAILVGDFDSTSAGQILDDINYAESIKWIYDKRRLLERARLQFGSLPFLGTVVNSLVLTGLFCVASIMVGAILGSIFFYLRSRRENYLADRSGIIRLKIYER